MRASRMLWSEKKINDIKEPSTYELLEKISIINYPFDDHKMYSYFPIGQKIINKLEKIMREEMGKSDIQEIYLPPLQPYFYWEKSGRDEQFNKSMIFTKGRYGIGDSRYVLSPTNEEVATTIAKNLIHSYKQLPTRFYQIADKFRDDKGAKHGIVRTNVFRMLESYSIDSSKEGLDESSSLFFETFDRIFSRLDLETIALEKRDGYTTFLSISDEGDTKIGSCDCGKKIIYRDENFCDGCNEKFIISQGIELGCIMKENDRYSLKFNAQFQDSNFNKNYFHLGTYALGVSRILHSVAEQNRSGFGIKWPNELVPYDVVVFSVNNTIAQEKKCGEIHQEMKNNGFDVVWEDRKKTMGEKIKTYDDIGVPRMIIVGDKELETNSVVFRKGNSSKTIPESAIISEIENL